MRFFYWPRGSQNSTHILGSSCVNVLPSFTHRCQTCIATWKLSLLILLHLPLSFRGVTPKIFHTSNSVLASASQRIWTDTHSFINPIRLDMSPWFTHYAEDVEIFLAEFSNQLLLHVMLWDLSHSPGNSVWAFLRY